MVDMGCRFMQQRHEDKRKEKWTAAQSRLVFDKRLALENHDERIEK